jgi:cysteine desulfurase/selenocysteine lyase
MDGVANLDGVRVVGTAKEKAGVLSFVVEGLHAHDVGTLLDEQGIAVRTGHHCTQPLMARLGVEATARASFAVYNTEAEVDRFVQGLDKVLRLFR